ncbi:hypothetical protein Vadar_003369 [Vaccinium darrowii]|uniref:Uncharacterized protein n=1 Tax=Vaccinium darrowii TaxID=229202 RepID=A0ACB7ZJ96_9ERIC|nr:hypothetical protein Vadar_003369 [Vaccinium darrowii]
MERKTRMVVFGVVSAVVLQCAAAQTMYVVGDSLGWTIPQNGEEASVSWASNKTFMVGDVLIFNFVTNEQVTKDSYDALQVTKDSYDACTETNPIGSTITTGQASIALTTAGDHYYICTYGRHCQLGQKLTITVFTSGTPGSAPPPTSTTAPPPPRSSVHAFSHLEHHTRSLCSGPIDHQPHCRRAHHLYLAGTSAGTTSGFFFTCGLWWFLFHRFEHCHCRPVLDTIEQKDILWGDADGEEEAGGGAGTCPGEVEVVGPPTVGLVVDGAGTQASGVVLKVGEGVDGGSRRRRSSCGSWWWSGAGSAAGEDGDGEFLTQLAVAAICADVVVVAGGGESDAGLTGGDCAADGVCFSAGVV